MRNTNGRKGKPIVREPTLGINKYQFCVDCKDIVGTPEGNTCPARFNPYDEDCTKHEVFVQREREKMRYATRQK